MKYLADQELNLEMIASKLISGITYPKDYINILTHFCKLENVNISTDLTYYLEGLQKMIGTSFGLLDFKETEKYYYGKNPDLFNLLTTIKSYIDTWIPIYNAAFHEREVSLIEELTQELEGKDFVEMGDAINKSNYLKQELDSIHTTELSLLSFKGSIDLLVRLYGSSQIKLPKKQIKVSIDPEYQLFLKQLASGLDNSMGNMDTALIVGRLIKSIEENIPKDHLDPYKTSQAENLLDVLVNPKDYYSDCRTDKILNDPIAQTFKTCYPAFYEKYIDMYLEDYPSMDYIDQMIFRRCFALPENNGPLLSLTNQYIKLGYT